MTKIQQFPDDHHFWLVKWIDGFRLPHKATRSASVSIFLQKLPYTTKSEIQAIRKDEAQTILGHSSIYKHPAPAVTKVRAHASILTLLTVGDVYFQQERVGHLPTSSAKLSIGDLDRDLTTVQLKDQLKQPPGWSTDMPYSILNPFEYFGVKHQFNSYCALFEHNKIQFIIPHTTIFRCFYGPTHDLVKTFLHGPWPLQQQKVIYLGETESGLKTQVSPEGYWDLVLTERVKFDYAFHLAPLYFDPYGRECAESIYAHALKSRNGRVEEPWFCRALIPYRSTNKPLTIKLTGFFLKRRSGPYRDSSPRKFLATRILSCDLPDYIPRIRIERTNSGERSKDGNITVVDLPPPFYSARRTKPANSETTIDSDYDSSLDYDGTDIPSDSFYWTNKPELEKLEKQSSKLYSGARPPTPDITSLDRTSLGEANFQKTSLPQSNPETVIREPNKRFSYLISALNTLIQSKDIRSYHIYPPTSTLQTEKRAGLTCWNILDQHDLLMGQKPRSGWRVLESKPSPNANYKVPIQRCVLILQIVLRDEIGYWFEIESRETEAGFYSPFLLTSLKDPNELINDVLDLIGGNMGRNLRQHLVELTEIHDISAVHCYKHHYENKRTGKLSLRSLKNFFQKAAPDIT